MGVEAIGYMIMIAGMGASAYAANKQSKQAGEARKDEKEWQQKQMEHQKSQEDIVLKKQDFQVKEKKKQYLSGSSVLG